MHFQIDTGSSIFMNCSFDAKGNFNIGKGSTINSNCRIDTRGVISIGDNVSISEDVILLTADHDMNTFNFSGRIKDIIVEDYVWIGTCSMILPGVVLGRGSVVAAGAVVTKSVEPYAVVAGVPARKIRTRLCQDDLNYTATYRRFLH